MLTDMLPLVFITKLNLGGIERFCTTLCNEWSRQGRRFLLYVSYDGGEMRHVIQAQEDVVVANIPARYAIWTLLRLCRKHPNSPLLVLNAEIGVVLLIARFLHAINNGIIFRESTAIFSHCSWWWQQVYRLIISRADGFVAQSPQGVSNLHKLVPTKKRTKIIYTPCGFIVSESPKAFMPRTGQGVHLLILGRLAPMKGHVRLLNALNRANVAHWHLTIAGDGDCREEIEAEIGRLGLVNQVEMLGEILDVRPVYEAADVFVMASCYEGLPNTLIEAIACGCRVMVVEGDGGTAEFMRKIGLADFIFSAEQFENRFASSLGQVLASESEKWLTAYRKMESLVRPDVVANQFWTFLSECSSEGKPQR